MNPVEHRIREIVASKAGLPFDMPGDANLYLDLGVASVYALQLLAELEQQFDVLVPDEEFVDATTVNELTAMVERLTAGGRGVPPEPEGIASA
jgi:acyl carrier protein